MAKGAVGFSRGLCLERLDEYIHIDPSNLQPDGSRPDGLMEYRTAKKKPAPRDGSFSPSRANKHEWDLSR